MAENQASEERLLEEVKALNTRLDDANRAVAQSKLAARGVMIALFIVVIFGIWSLFRPAYSAWQHPEPYREAFTDELQNRILPHLQAQFEDIMRTSGREIFVLVRDKAQGRSDDIAKSFENELSFLMEELQEFGESTLAETVVDFELKLREKLADLIGEDAASEENVMRVLDNAAAAVESAVKRAVEKELNYHINEIIHLEEQINNFPVPTELKAMDDAELSEYMVNEMGRYALLILKQTFTPETREMLRELAD